MESRAPARQESFQVTLRDVAAPFFRYWRVLLGTFLCAFALAAWAGFSFTHRYTSRMTISVRPGPHANESVVSDAEMQSLQALLKGRDLLEKVAAANHLEQHSKSVDEAIESLAAAMVIEVPHKGQLMQVSYESTDASLAYRILRSLATFALALNEGTEQTSRALALNRPVLALAVPPAMPVLPAHNAASILLLAFILALVVTSLAGYLSQYFDPFFHSPAEVSDVLGIPVVEAIPKKIA